MARPRKTLSAHAKDRTFREDRHGGMVPDAAFAGDLPERPADLTATELAVWDRVVGTAPDGVLRAIDEAELAGLCNWYGEWRRLMDLMRQTEVEAKAYFRYCTLAAIAWKHFATAASRFGMTPADRARLRLSPKNEEEEDALTMLSMIGAKRTA